MRWRTLIVSYLAAPTVTAAAQRPVPDTTHGAPLSAVIVTADRAGGRIRSSVSAVTRIARRELSTMPHATLADLLRLAPGFTVVDFDGLGYDPQVMARGFYGGGEAEYVVVLVDGKPVNQLQSGTVTWNALPSAASIEAIEVVRGGASSLYGDAAVAGVINVITRNGTGGRDLRWDASAGSFGTYHVAGDASLPGWQHTNVSASFDRTAGFRDHAGRSAGRAHAALSLLDHPDASLALTLGSYWRAVDDPGAQLESIGAAKRNASDALFRFDHTKDHDHTLSLDGAKAIGANARLTSSVGGEYRATDAFKTLALAPGFGDTKERDATASRVTGSAQLEIVDTPIPGADRVIVGGEANHGALDSKYYQVTGGPRAAYAGASGQRGALDTQASSSRTSGALYADYSLRPFDVMRLSLGGRVDRLDDSFDPRVPAGQSKASPTHTAFSPKAGANVAYAGGTHPGNVYAAASTSFKAPTLDQLYDQRNIPVPFPPFAIRTSNPDLRPQHAANFEVGIYQSADWSATRRLSASASLFQTDMTDELDFDIQTFRYVNIGRSRHRGVEAGANLTSQQWSAFATYAMQSAIARSGDFSGNRLKAIPRQTAGGGVSVRATRWIETSMFAAHCRGIYLDDANTVTLPNYTRVDGRAAIAAGSRSVFVDVRNLFDARYSSSGFLDPSGSGATYLYPAAGRVLEIGVRGGW